MHGEGGWLVALIGCLRRTWAHAWRASERAAAGEEPTAPRGLSLSHGASRAMHAVPRFETFTRLGFAARGVLYILIAYLAIAAGRNAGSADVLRSLAEGGASRLVLVIIALGLLAYRAWRGLEAAMDLEGAGQGAKGAATRLGHGMSGLAHLVLGLLAAGLALGLVGSGGSGGEGPDKATGMVIDFRRAASCCDWWRSALS